jgi:hypothetical protein
LLTNKLQVYTMVVIRNNDIVESFIRLYTGTYTA